VEVSYTPKTASHDHAVYEWKLKADSEGAAVPVLDYNRAAIQVSGTPSGARVCASGRIDTVHEFTPMNDNDGFPAAGLRPGKLFDIPNLMVAELKPIVYGGNDETEVTVTIIVKR